MTQLVNCMRSVGNFMRSVDLTPTYMTPSYLLGLSVGMITSVYLESKEKYTEHDIAMTTLASFGILLASFDIYKVLSRISVRVAPMPQGDGAVAPIARAVDARVSEVYIAMVTPPETPISSSHSIITVPQSLPLSHSNVTILGDVAPPV